MREFTQKFVKYDADFEYGAELPEIFLKYVSILVTKHSYHGHLSIDMIHVLSSVYVPHQRLEGLQVLAAVPVQADGGGNSREAGSWQRSGHSSGAAHEECGQTKCSQLCTATALGLAGKCRASECVRIGKVDDDHCDYLSLSLFLSPLLPTFKAVFWCLAHIMADKELHRTLKDSIQQMNIFTPGVLKALFFSVTPNWSLILKLHRWRQFFSND